MTKNILATIAIAVVASLFLIFFYVSTQEKIIINKTSITDECRNNGAIWLEEWDECENIGKSWCDSNNGRFKECESACRHDSEAEICTMQCVLVCQLGEEKISYGNDPKNLTYEIEGSKTTLVDGKAEEETAPGSATKKITKIFDTNKFDINNDGLEDIVITLVQDNGGSGTFYYASAALNSHQGYFGLNSIFVGDRIAPETINFKDGIINFNYADRYPWQAYNAKAGVEKTKYIKIVDNKLKEPIKKILSQEDAKKIAINNWGECGADCDNLEIKILDGNDNVWYVEAIYSGLLDDSVQSRKNTIMTFDSSETWLLGEERPAQYICQKGRGQTEFEEAYCE